MQIKSILFSLFFALPIVLFSQIDVFHDHTHEIAASESKRFNNFKIPAHERTGGEIDITYTRFFWEINPEVLFIKGCVTHYFSSKVPQLSEVNLELNSDMQIDPCKRKPRPSA